VETAAVEPEGIDPAGGGPATVRRADVDPADDGASAWREPDGGADGQGSTTVEEL